MKSGMSILSQKTKRNKTNRKEKEKERTVSYKKHLFLFYKKTRNAFCIVNHFVLHGPFFCSCHHIWYIFHSSASRDSWDESNEIIISQTHIITCVWHEAEFEFVDTQKQAIFTSRTKAHTQSLKRNTQFRNYRTHSSKLNLCFFVWKNKHRFPLTL